MADKPDANNTAKILSDLWIHQNRLMWDRLQLLAILQAAFLGAAYTLHVKNWPVAVFFVCLFAIVISAALMHTANIDRAIRDKHRDKLLNLGIEVRLQFDNPDDMKRHDDASWGQVRFNSKYYIVAIFVFAMAADAAAMFILMS